MADSTLSNLTSLTLPSQATDLLLVGRGTARPNKVAMSDALNSSALAATTSTYGVAQLAASGGTTAGTVVQATDARLSDARNPPDGSKGDIVVSGSGSTWTIKTNPTLSGNVTATGKITAQGTTAFPYEGQLIASNSSPSGTNSAVSQAILQAQPGYSTFVGTTGDGTTASYRTGGLGNVVVFSQSYLIGDGASGMLLHSINGPTIFATQNTGSEKMRLALNGNLLLGTATDSANGRLQLATHTAITGGIGFGADTALYRSAANVLRAEGTSTSTLQINGQSGFSSTLSFQRANTNRWTVECDSSDILRFKLLGTTTVLTLDASQNATLSKGLTTNGDSDTHISFVRNGTVSIGPDSTATPSLIVSTGITVSGGSFKQASFYKSTSLGSVLSGATGTSYDLYLTNPAGNYVLQVPTGTRNSEFAGTISSVGNISSAATLISSVNTDSGVLQLNLVNSSTGTSASSLLRFNAGTRTASLQAYNDTHATLAGQLRIATSNGNITFVPSGVAAMTLSASDVTLQPTGAGQVIIANNSGAGTATRLTISQPGVRLFYIENTATTGNLTVGDGGGEYLRLIGSGAGAFLFGTATNSNNGRLQLATHTATTGGIGFGTDASLYRYQSGGLAIEHIGGTIPALSLRVSGLERAVFYANGSTSVVLAASAAGASLDLQTGGTTALIIDSAHNFTFSGTTKVAFPTGTLLGMTGTTAALTTSTYALYQDGSQTFLNVATGGSVQLRVNNVEHLRVFSGGNVGIGVSGLDSGAKLQVGTNTTTAAGGLIFGTDVSLYRSAASTVTIGGNLVVSGTVVDPAITGTILEDIFTITDAAAFEVDPGNGSIQLITLGASRTPKATNFAAGESVTLMVNDGTAYTLTWTDSTWGTGGVVWVGGSAPTLATSGYTVIQFWKVGTQIYGARVGDVA